jgi:hypothetical protein
MQERANDKLERLLTESSIHSKAPLGCALRNATYQKRQTTVSVHVSYSQSDGVLSLATPPRSPELSAVFRIFCRNYEPENTFLQL